MSTPLPSSLATPSNDELYFDLLNQAGVALPESGGRAAATPISGTCSMLRQRVRAEQRWAQNYSWLVFFVGVITVILIGAAAVLIIAAQAPGAVLSGAGAIVSGIATGWLVSQRSASQNRYDEAIRAYSTANC